MKRLILLVLVLVLALGALGPTTSAQDQKALVVGWPQELDTLNPIYSTMWFVGITQSLYLSGAWHFDGEGNPVPVLVTEIPSLDNGGLSEDGTVITIKLRDDIVWSDGEPITSADFVFTYDMVMSDSNTPLTRYPYDLIAGIEAPDAATVVVTFDEPFAPWLATLFGEVLPQHVLQPVFDDEFTIDNAAWNRAPTVGSGPYIFDEWETGSYIRFTRNENFFDDPGNIDVVAVNFIPDDAAYVIALGNGEIDLGTFVAHSDVPGLEETGIVDVAIIPSGYNEAWFFNVNEATAHPAMLDVNVRKALVMGFNRWQITEDLLLGLTYPAATFWENTPFGNPDVEALPFDPAMAAQLLDEAGWVDSDGDGIRDKDGEKLSLRYITNTRGIRMDTQVVAQQQLGEIGVDIVLENYPSDIYFNGYGAGGPVATGQYDIAEWSAQPNYPDPDTSRFLCREIPSDEAPDGGNWNGICDEQLDALFIQEASTMDYDARVQVFYQIAERMDELVIWASIWHDADVWIINKRVEGEALNGATPFWNITTWDIVE